MSRRRSVYQSLFSFIIIFLLMSHNQLLAANADKFKDVYKNFALGLYADVVSELEKAQLGDDKKLLGIKAYLMGISYSRLQEFDKAQIAFNQAIKLDNPSEDLFYEFGQALYANNNLEEARKAFQASYQKNFKKIEALYYMGHISQILEEYKQAQKYYGQLVKEDGVDKKMKQVAYLQYANVGVEIADQEKNTNELIGKYVLPLLKKGLEIDPDSEVGFDIQKRKTEIERNYGFDPNFLVNGRQLPPNSLNLDFEQKVTYDDNVALATDQATVETTDVDSYIFDTSAYAKYRFVFLRRFIMTPEMGLKNVYHSNRSSSTVFKNDSIAYMPAMRFKYEHKLFKEMATASFDVEYNITERDREAKHDKIFYGRSTTYSFAEKFKKFSIGDTSIKLKYKDYSAYTESMNSKTYSLQLNQRFQLPTTHLVNFVFQADMAKVNDDNNSTNTYLFIGNYIIPKLFESSYMVNLGTTLTLLDTKAQKATRGIERTINPSITVTKKVTDKFSLDLKYDYTKNSSKNEAENSYTKKTIGIEFKYSY